MRIIESLRIRRKKQRRILVDDERNSLSTYEYFAVRDSEKNYLGTLEVSQDATKAARAHRRKTSPIEYARVEAVTSSPCRIARYFYRPIYLSTR